MAKIDAFGHIITDEQNAIGSATGDGLLAQYVVELDKETGNTKPVQTDPISIPELVKSYEDQCGMEWARRMLRSGQITPADLADDGKHGGDFTGTTSINVAYRQAQEAKANGDAVAKQLGLEGYMKAEDVDALVKQRIEEILKSQQPAPAASEGETK